ncbi:hypothetical protein [Nonomuraea sp. B19D2]|uniref:hypothetical protein n=1 Tax=Nonomuraea sp. B19D2 TaxID=3159561 RepID=UPI0032DA0671
MRFEQVLLDLTVELWQTQPFPVPDLYGLLCMEVLHQLDFADTDLEPVFEECLHELAGILSVEYRPTA